MFGCRILDEVKMLRIMVLVFIAVFSSPAWGWGWEKYEGYEEDRFEARFEIFDDVMLTLLCPDKQKTLPAAIEYWHWKNKSARRIELNIDGISKFNIDLLHKNQLGRNQFVADSYENRIKFNTIVDALKNGSELVIKSPGKGPVAISLKGSYSVLKDCRA
jgi:hypothetical protein